MSLQILTCSCCPLQALDEPVFLKFAHYYKTSLLAPPTSWLQVGMNSMEEEGQLAVYDKHGIDSIIYSNYMPSSFIFTQIYQTPTRGEIGSELRSQKNRRTIPSAVEEEF